MTKLANQIEKIQTQMKNPNTKADVKRQMDDFLPVRKMMNDDFVLISYIAPFSLPLSTRSTPLAN